MTMLRAAAFGAALFAFATPALAADPFAGEWNLKGAQLGREATVRLQIREDTQGDLSVGRFGRYTDGAEPKHTSWKASSVRRVGDWLLALYPPEPGIAGSVSGQTGTSVLALYRLDRNDSRRIVEQSWPPGRLLTVGQRSLGSLWETPEDLDTYRKLLDEQVVDGLRADPRDRLLRRVAIARTIIWRDLTYRLYGDTGFVPESGGEWRVGEMVHPVDGQTYQVVHWSDIDDNSWTIYFQDGQVYEAFYEN